MNERRELYKAMRSAHDGICPLCGGDVDKFCGHGAFSCQVCDFNLTVPEVAEIRSWHADFHRDLGTVLDAWRHG